MEVSDAKLKDFLQQHVTAEEMLHTRHYKFMKYLKRMLPTSSDF
jgi:hypothetical protein